MQTDRKIPPFPELANKGHGKYIADPRLQAAIEVALELGMPLLITGEPGTGKTALAYHLADTLGRGEEDVLRFNTKTTSQAKDLLYKYDALAHFRDASLKKENLNVMQYITPQALGEAIIRSNQRRHIVLVDEIDKAPRDFPNDLLFEFEKMAFRIEEATRDEVKAHFAQLHSQQPDLPAVPIDEQGTIKLAEFEHEGKPVSNRPILILTSNSEKNLPEPFLRRCVYYHIPFPSREILLKIVEPLLTLTEEFQQGMVDAAIEHFIEIRDQKNLRKKPATAELLSWLMVLQKNGLDFRKINAQSDREIKEWVLSSYTLLAKNKEDLQRLRTDLGL